MGVTQYLAFSCNDYYWFVNLFENPGQLNGRDYLLEQSYSTSVFVCSQNCLL